MMWIDDCNDIIKNCGKLSTLGIQKSFSTSDITELSNKKTFETNSVRNSYGILLRHAVSSCVLNSTQRCGYFLESSGLSRSCSTWVQVAVGELASQLPSPHGHCTSLTITSSQQQLNSSSLIGSSPIATSQPFTSTDLIKSVNKKVRETYIRSRLLTTNRAIERLSQSEFNLDQLASVAITSSPVPGPTELIVPSNFKTKDTNAESMSSNVQNEDSATKSEQANTQINVLGAITNTSISPKIFSIPHTQKFTRNLTIHDIEKERGRPLSKYDRNMMIFNWLHSLDETSAVEDE